MIEPENSWTIEKQTAQARNLSRFEELTVTIPGKIISPPSVSSQPIPRNEKARENMANQRFIKYIPSEKSEWLLRTHPNAFLLLCLIATRARRASGYVDGLEIGDAYIGDYASAGIESERKYRTAKDVLCALKIIRIKETCRNRKKSTTGTTTVGTLVSLLDSSVWDINSDDRNDDRPTTDRRPTDDEQERKRKKKKEEEITHHPDAAKLLDDFFQSLLSSLPENHKIDPSKLRPDKKHLDPLDALLKLHPPEKIRRVFDFAHMTDFWKPIVLTTKKLHEKFDILSLQMGRNQGKPNENNPKHSQNNANQSPAEPKFVGRLVPE